MTEEEHLAHLREGIEEATERTHTLVEVLTREQLLWSPEPERWGVAECLEHLVLTGQAWHPKIETALQEAEPAPASPQQEYRPTLFGRFFLGLAGKKVWIPMPTGPMFEPGEEVSADAPERFLDQQGELLELIEAARGVDLRAVRVSFPQWSRLHLRLGEALTLLVQHQHRHLRQAGEVRQAAAFPSREATV